MKIVDRKTFLTYPAETLYSTYEPCFFGPLCIKGDTLWTARDTPIGGDFISQQIHDAIACHDTSDYCDRLEQAQATGASVEMDFECASRDGCFVADQLFAVWELTDVAALISRLEPVLDAFGPDAAT